MLARLRRQDYLRRHYRRLFLAVALLHIKADARLEVSLLMRYRAVARQGRELNSVFERRVIHLYIVRSDAVVKQPVVISAVDVNNGLCGLNRVVCGQNIVAVDEGQVPFRFVYLRHLRRESRVCVCIFRDPTRGGFCGLLSCCLFGLRRGLLRGRFGRGALRRFGLRLA